MIKSCQEFVVAIPLDFSVIYRATEKSIKIQCCFGTAKLGSIIQPHAFWGASLCCHTCWLLTFVGGVVFKGTTTDPLSRHFCKAELVNATGRWSKTGQTHLAYKTFDSCCHLLLWFSALSIFILSWRSSLIIDCLAGTILHESSLAPIFKHSGLYAFCRAVAVRHAVRPTLADAEVTAAWECKGVETLRSEHRKESQRWTDLRCGLDLFFVCMISKSCFMFHDSSELLLQECSCALMWHVVHVRWTSKWHSLIMWGVRIWRGFDNRISGDW